MSSGWPGSQKLGLGKLKQTSEVVPGFCRGNALSTSEKVSLTCNLSSFLCHIPYNSD